MDTKAILTSLREEQSRIGKAIEALEALGDTTSRRQTAKKSAGGAGSPKIRRRKPLSPAAKKHLSEMMKKRWAERKRKNKA